MTDLKPEDLVKLRLADDALVMQDHVNSFELRIFQSGDQWSARYLGDTAKDIQALLADRARMEKALTSLAKMAAQAQVELASGRYAHDISPGMFMQIEMEAIKAQGASQ